MQKIDFQIDTKYGQYCDAICFPDDASMTDDEIAIEKQRRLDNWIAVIETPSEA
jgi:hypothetical protein